MEYYYVKEIMKYYNAEPNAVRKIEKTLVKLAPLIYGEDEVTLNLLDMPEFNEKHKIFGYNPYPFKIECTVTTLADVLKHFVSNARITTKHTYNPNELIPNMSIQNGYIQADAIMIFEKTYFKYSPHESVCKVTITLPKTLEKVVSKVNINWETCFATISEMGFENCIFEFDLALPEIVEAKPYFLVDLLLERDITIKEVTFTDRFNFDRVKECRNLFYFYSDYLWDTSPTEEGFYSEHELASRPYLNDYFEIDLSKYIITNKDVINNIKATSLADAIKLSKSVDAVIEYEPYPSFLRIGKNDYLVTIKLPKSEEDETRVVEEDVTRVVIDWCTCFRTLFGMGADSCTIRFDLALPEIVEGIPYNSYNFPELSTSSRNIEILYIGFTDRFNFDRVKECKNLFCFCDKTQKGIIQNCDLNLSKYTVSLDNISVLEDIVKTSTSYSYLKEYPRIKLE